MVPPMLLRIYFAVIVLGLVLGAIWLTVITTRERAPGSAALREELESIQASPTNAPPMTSNFATRASRRCLPLANGKSFDVVVAAFNAKDASVVTRWLNVLANITLNVTIYRRIPEPLGLEGLVTECGTKVRQVALLPNRGFEAPVYLDYIMRNYDSLADVSAFVHADGPYQWHSKEEDFFRRICAVYEGLWSEPDNRRSPHVTTVMLDLNACPCFASASHGSAMNFNWVSWSPARSCASFPAAASCRTCPANDAPSKCKEAPAGGQQVPKDPGFDAELYPFQRSYWPDPRGGAYEKYARVISAVWKAQGVVRDNYATKSFDPCCAQFILPRHRIKIHSKETYEKLRDIALDRRNEMPDDHALSRLFEWSWRRLFNSSVVFAAEALLYHTL